MLLRGAHIIGIDEVGRGPLAGPVVVAAAAIPARLAVPVNKLGEVRDSKKLTAPARERWFAWLSRHPGVLFAVARVYPRTVDRINIYRAANLAAARACNRLIGLLRKNRFASRNAIYLDGGLYIQNKQVSAGLGAKTVVRGDEKIRAIAFASIIAKVTRDRAMARLAKRYPEYGFDVHKGYGTRLHKARLRAHGPSPAHRLTFVS